MPRKPRSRSRSKGRGTGSAKSEGRLIFGLLGVLLAGGLIWLVESSRKAPKDQPSAVPEAPQAPQAIEPLDSPREIEVPRIEPPRLPVDGASEQSARAPAVSALADPLLLQVVLDRLGFSPGSIDGRPGTQTRLALAALRARLGQPPGFSLPDVPEVRAAAAAPVLREVVVDGEDLAALRPRADTWESKAALDYLGHTSLLERMAEQAHAHPDLIERLNPGFPWNAPAAGMKVRVPDARRIGSPGSAALVRISLGSKTLQALDSRGRILFHCPVSIARRVEKRPKGSLSVVNLSDAPNYTFDPATFPDSPEAQAVGRKLILQPGPNNPVGTTWIGLDLPGYGMHGTPNPEQVGRTESSGCFRMANWNAEHLLRLVSVGTQVLVED